jgi:hypothetical protein
VVAHRRLGDPVVLPVVHAQLVHLNSLDLLPWMERNASDRVDTISIK